MRVIADDRVAWWVAERVPGCSRGFGDCRAFAVTDSEFNILAGVVFHNWNPEAEVIEVSAAADNPKWISRETLTELFSYAYGLCGCQAVVVRTGEDNTRTRRLWRAFGATEHIIPRLRGPDAAEVVMILPKETWEASPFYKVQDGKTKPA